jgi:ERCC4-type nuclease
MSEGRKVNGQLDEFVREHPEGWNHEEWLSLLSDLEGKGVDVSERDEIGAELERTRITWELQRRSVPGLGPKRAEAIAKRFGSLWRLQHASPEEVAKVPSMNRALAEKVLSALD